ncbi:hypothetical protein M408DRAFT_21361 [Serendipita vermifera MAFF 305830]|uniref:USP domain-containing protein n=1 Tax=Serendipita vermifera MAFF 305830 TaxID=933852 RepID=A0A0C2XQR7_SERVB|nr:hypothetical protein M408DRAFT_21361 [Serendipita vermifera MAFF 305830]
MFFPPINSTWLYHKCLLLLLCGNRTLDATRDVLRAAATVCAAAFNQTTADDHVFTFDAAWDVPQCQAFTAMVASLADLLPSIKKALAEVEESDSDSNSDSPSPKKEKASFPPTLPGHYTMLESLDIPTQFQKGFGPLVDSLGIVPVPRQKKFLTLYPHNLDPNRFLRDLQSPVLWEAVMRGAIFDISVTKVIIPAVPSRNLFNFNQVPKHPGACYRGLVYVRTDKSFYAIDLSQGYEWIGATRIHFTKQSKIRSQYVQDLSKQPWWDEELYVGMQILLDTKCAPGDEVIIEDEDWEMEDDEQEDADETPYYIRFPRFTAKMAEVANLKKDLQDSESADSEEGEDVPQMEAQGYQARYPAFTALIAARRAQG